MFYVQVDKLSKEKRTTPTAVTLELGYSKGSMSHWKKGKPPNCDIVINFAKYFDVSTDYILGLNEFKHLNLTSDESELLNDYQSLSHQGKEFIRQTMVAALHTYKKDFIISDMENSTITA